MNGARRVLACGVVLMLGCLGCAGRRAAVAAARDRVQADALNQRALAQIDAGDYAAAQASLESAVAADPWSGAARNNLGLVQLKLGRPFEAAQEFQNAIRLLPRASAPRTNLGILLEKAGQFPEAETQLLAALDAAPDDIEIIGALARLRVRQSRFDPQTIAWLKNVAASEEDPAWRDWARRTLVLHAHSPSPPGDVP